MLEVHNLAVSYRNTYAISDVTFSLKSGQLVALLGPNGAGKSTMVKAMLGLLPVASGTVKFGSYPLLKQLQRVAYVPQRTQIDWDYPITVWDVAMTSRTKYTGWFRQPSRQSLKIVRAALERVGMLEYYRSQIGELSGGQQQRVFLARALAQQAELLFFDEPFVGVDQKTEKIIFEVFSELKFQNKTLLVISHDLGESLKHYDQLLLLNKQLVAAGSREQVLTAVNLNKAYGQGRKLLAV